MLLSCPQISCGIVVKIVGSTHPIGHHMLGPEGHLSVFGSSSLHFPCFLLVKDVLRAPDYVPIFYYRPYIGFVQISKGSFSKLLKCFTNYGYNTIGFLSNSSGMVMKLQLFVDLYS